jgi:F0F1-type ATP synthase assembly protein I
MQKYKVQRSEKILEKYNKAKVSLYYHVFGITLGNILIFLLFGYIIDMQLGTRPWGLVIAFILSFILTQYFLYKYVKNQSSNGFNNNKPSKNTKYR